MTEALQTESMASWQPRELIARLQKQPRETFVRAQNSKLYLVVVLDAVGSELALGLSASHAAEPDGLPFRTAALSGMHHAVNDSGRPSSPSFDTRVVETPAVEKVRGLCSFACYVIPLHKRVEAAFLSSISVGRARNHDIVLRHTSVSKFHANLEINEGQLFVKDAGSRNHTFVNHERIMSRTEVKPGDNLRFGWVEALVATDEALWTAARRR